MFIDTVYDAGKGVWDAIKSSLQADATQISTPEGLFSPAGAYSLADMATLG